MSDQPLGIRNLIEEHPETGAPEFGECWFWCRRHEQTHKFGEKCYVMAYSEATELMVRKDLTDCIDLGPFMSEREANRLGEVQVTLSPVSGHYTTRCALGMEVEV